MFKHLPPTPPFFPGSTSFPFLYLLPPEQHRGTRNGGYGQFITCCLCRSLSLSWRTPHTLPLLQCEGPSRRQFSTNFSNVSPSHGLQLFTNCPSVGPSHGVQLFTTCCSMGPFHGVQSFRNRLLQYGCPTESQALPINLLHCGLLSPWVHRSWQEPAPAWPPHGVTDYLRHLPAPVWDPFHGL